MVRMQIVQRNGTSREVKPKDLMTKAAWLAGWTRQVGNLGYDIPQLEEASNKAIELFNDLRILTHGK